MDVVRDGDEALNYLFRRGAFADRPEGLPVVVLLDLKMPKVDGLQVLQQVRADSVVGVVPIVMLTHNTIEERFQGALTEIEGLAFVRKPMCFFRVED